MFLDRPAAGLRTALGTAIGLPGRVVNLVTEAEQLIGQTRALLASVESTTTEAGASVLRVSRLLDSTDAVLARTENITEDATETLGAARSLTQDGSAMLAQIRPELEKMLPLLEKFAAGLSPVEVDAAIKLVDELPALTRSLRDDVMPILGTLDQVGPDINELLHVMDDVRHAILGVPGFAFFKKRGGERIEEVDHLDPHPRDERLARSS